jgi:hypothetical protein
MARRLTTICSFGCLLQWVGHLRGDQRILPYDLAPSQEEPKHGSLEWARAWGGRLGAEAFSLQDDGMLLCPQGVRLWLSEIRQENAFTERPIYVAKDAACAPCLVRAACLGRTASGKRGRRVSAVRHRRITGVLLHPRPSMSAGAGCICRICRHLDVAALPGRSLRAAAPTVPNTAPAAPESGSKMSV